GAGPRSTRNLCPSATAGGEATMRIPAKRLLLAGIIMLCSEFSYRDTATENALARLNAAWASSQSVDARLSAIRGELSSALPAPLGLIADSGRHQVPHFDGAVLHAAAGKPNIIRFVIDDLDLNTFNEALAAGYLPFIKTYFMDRGVVFDNSFVPISACCPDR